MVFVNDSVPPAEPFPPPHKRFVPPAVKGENVSFKHKLTGLVTVGAAGSVFIVTFVVVVKMEHPPGTLYVYVTKYVPVLLAPRSIVPVDELMDKPNVDE